MFPRFRIRRNFSVLLENPIFQVASSFSRCCCLQLEQISFKPSYTIFSGYSINKWLLNCYCYPTRAVYLAHDEQMALSSAFSELFRHPLQFTSFRRSAINKNASRLRCVRDTCPEIPWPINRILPVRSCPGDDPGHAFLGPPIIPICRVNSAINSRRILISPNNKGGPSNYCRSSRFNCELDGLNRGADRRGNFGSGLLGNNADMAGGEEAHCSCVTGPGTMSHKFLLFRQEGIS